MSAPKLCMFLILRNGKFGNGNSTYDIKWGAHTLWTFSQDVFTFRLLDFTFLCRSHEVKNVFFYFGKKQKKLDIAVRPAVFETATTNLISRNFLRESRGFFRIGRGWGRFCKVKLKLVTFNKVRYKLNALQLGGRSQELQFASLLSKP
jgi:hypothetical protein